MKSIRFALIVCAVLVILGGVVLWKLVTLKEPAIEQPKVMEAVRSRIIATRELQALTLLKDTDLEVRLGTAASSQKILNIQELTSRYLLVSVKRGAEVKDDMVATRDATSLLADAVAVSIPASPTTSLGGQLRVGDLVDVIAIRKESPEAKKVEKLLVLNVIPGNKETNLSSVIILAVPSGQRDDFASKTAGAELLVTRKISVQ